jgi:aspartyl protease family protein
MIKPAFIIFILSVLLGLKVSGQTSIKMEKKNGVYYVPCTVNGLKLKFIFDTGAGDVSISLSEALFMLKNNYLKKEDIKGSEYYEVASGEILEGTKIIIRTLKVGDKTLTNVEASVVHTMSAPLLLGQSALERFGKYSFDYSTNTLKIGGGNKNDVPMNPKLYDLIKSSENPTYDNGEPIKANNEDVKKAERPSSSEVGYLVGTNTKWKKSKSGGYYYYYKPTGYYFKKGEDYTSATLENGDVLIYNMISKLYCMLYEYDNTVAEVETDVEFESTQDAVFIRSKSGGFWIYDRGKNVSDLKFLGYAIDASAVYRSDNTGVKYWIPNTLLQTGAYSKPYGIKSQ